MAFNAELADRVRVFFRDRSVSVEEKRMMGGLCFMVNGKMCVGVEKDRLMVRLDPERQDEALRVDGCEPMDFTGRPMRGFVFVAPEGCRTSKRLHHWLELAMEFNPKARASRKRGVSRADGAGPSSSNIR